jgi:hypothetical protein
MVEFQLRSELDAVDEQLNLRRNYPKDRKLIAELEAAILQSQRELDEIRERLHTNEGTSSIELSSVGNLEAEKSALDSVGSSSPTKILAPIVQAVAVLVVNLGPIRTEVFVHVNLPTINPCSCVRRPLSIH